MQETINQLVARRRYLMSAMLRPMVTYVRRVRGNLERLQNRLSALSSAGSGPNRPGGPNRPSSSIIDSAALDGIRRRLDEITKRISDIVLRIRNSFTPAASGQAGQSGQSQGR